jgi:hypothetical protein
MIPNQDPNKKVYEQNGTYRDDVHATPLDKTLPMLPKTPAPKSFTIKGGGDGTRK